MRRKREKGRATRLSTLAMTGKRAVSSSKKHGINFQIDSAALQAHIATSLNLKLGAPVRTIRSRKKIASKIKLTKSKGAWQCKRCGTRNRSKGSKCFECGLSRVSSETTIEYNPAITLAQQRGLVAGPAPQLTREEWSDVMMRTSKRGDHAGTCTICCQKFGRKEQVVLSCSHVFHLDCLNSFERFLGKKKKKTCPLCRKADYQKKKCYAGFHVGRRLGATCIQALIRALAARKRVNKMLGELYQAGRGNPVLRKRFFAKGLRTVSARAAHIVSSSEARISALLAAASDAVRFSRQIFGGPPPAMAAAAAASALASPNPKDSVDWNSVMAKAKARSEDVCPICLNDLVGCSCADDKSYVRGQLTLLSCSHLFHTKCLRAFENFNIYEVLLCPVCRSEYTKQLLSKWT